MREWILDMPAYAGMTKKESRQTEKLVPQPHAAVTFGLLSLN